MRSFLLWVLGLWETRALNHNTHSSGPVPICQDLSKSLGGQYGLVWSAMFPCGECGNDMLRRQHSDGTHVWHVGQVDALLNTKVPQCVQSQSICEQPAKIFKSKHCILSIYLLVKSVRVSFQALFLLGCAEQCSQSRGCAIPVVHCTVHSDTHSDSVLHCKLSLCVSTAAVVQLYIA